MYNKCLKEGCFPKQWKKSSSPNYKAGKKNTDASKYRPISRQSAGQVNDRILHHVHSNAGLNSNQYGFIPQRGTVDAAMVIKEITEENLKQKNCISVVSLDIRGAFDAAQWHRYVGIC